MTYYLFDDGRKYFHNNIFSSVWPEEAELLANSATVNYNYSGAQTAESITYGNLTLSGSGIKTLQVQLLTEYFLWKEQQLLLGLLHMGPLQRFNITQLHPELPDRNG